MKRIYGTLIAFILTILFSTGFVQMSAAQTNSANEAQQSITQDGENLRSDYWQAVKEGVAGTTQSKGDGHEVLILASGEDWRVQKETQRFWVKWIVPGVLIVIFLYHLIIGGHKFEHRSGKKILRFSFMERLIHWFVAISFIILALTGLMLLLGRDLLLPLIGGSAYAFIANAAKFSHNFIGPVFLTAVTIMFVMWVKHNIPQKHDIEWLKKAGGMINKSAPPPAGKMNAGEKIWFWLIFFVGILCVGISGVIMDFPNLGADRVMMQWSNTIHTIGSVLLTVASFGHIYLGTKGVEGTFEGMKTGYVDENWAKEHHELWYEKVKK